MMLVWGLAVGSLAILLLLFLSPSNWPIMSSRAIDLRDALTVLKQGGPLLLGRHGSTGSYYPVGSTDDEGIYVYIPLLSNMFGVSSPTSMLRDVYVVLYGLLAAVYPVIFYRLTRSLSAALLAPLMMLVYVLSMGFDDIYWIPAWGMFALLPVVFLLARDWPRLGFLGLLGIALAASWLSSIRGDSGLGVAIAASIVLLMRRWRWWKLVPALALLAVTYLSINAFVLNAIRIHRDRWIANKALIRNQPTMHPLWHPAYLGLGYLPNNYGIYFSDSVAAARVQREAPGTAYLSSRYESVLRKAYFNIVREHPTEVVKQYAGKAIVTIADTTRYLFAVLLTVPAMLLLGPERRIRRRWLLLAIPALIVSFLPTMVAIPSQGYEEGLYAALGVIGILGMCWVVGQLEMATRSYGGVRESLSVLRFGRLIDHPRNLMRRSATVSCVAVIVLALFFIGGHFIRATAERWLAASTLHALIMPTPSRHADSIAHPQG
jgi:hypothetical protein